MKIDDKFLKKYNKSGPRYTSYPPATFFTAEYENVDLKNSIILSMMKTHKIFQFIFTFHFAHNFVISVDVQPKQDSQSHSCINM